MNDMAAIMANGPDMQIENHGSIFLLRPLTDDAREWIVDHLPHEVQTWGDAIVVEPRYIGDIVVGARADGLRVE